MIVFFMIPGPLPAQGGESGSKYDNPFTQAKFVPDISFILDGSFVRRNLKDDVFSALEIPGLSHSSAEEAEHGHVHASPNAKNGFNLNYGELAISSVVDPYFNLYGVFHLSEEGFEIEEGYFTTRQIPFGLQVKAGKFLSAFSRINEQHAHVWDFADPPLIQKAFFGGEGLNEKGIQLTWVPPLPWYFMLGGELLSGENESSFGRSGFQDKAGTLTVREKDNPNVATGFMRTSFDAGDLVVLAGCSGAFGGASSNHGLDAAGTEGHAVRADARVLGAGITLKYLINSNRTITVQSEIIHRKTDGTLYEKDIRDAVSAFSLLKKQSGWYGQAVVKTGPRTRAGIRYDRIGENGVWKDDARSTLPDGLDRFSAMAEFNPTEFSRIRLQYNFDRAMAAGEEGAFNRRTVREWILQYNLSIGAHGAHSF
jgi:hypothetical protein